MRRALAAAALGAILLVVNIGTQFWYVERSRAIPAEGSGFTEILGGSQSGLLTQLQQKVKSAAAYDRVFISDTYNIVLGKIEGGYTSPAVLTFPTTDMFLNLSRVPEGQLRLVKIGFDPHLIKAGQADQAMRDKYMYNVALNDTEFVLDRREQLADNNAELIRTGANLSPFNHWIADRPRGSDIDVVPLASQSNYLLFVPSSKGKPYYTGERTHVSFYQPERDYFTETSMMAAYGVFALFEVLKPTATIRLAIDVSETLRNDGENRLPRFVIYGQNLVTLTPQGSGSMRLLSPPVKPRNIQGHWLVAVTAEDSEFQFRPQRALLMNLFGRNVPIDPRHIVGFARDFSALGPNVTEHLERPRSLRHFPGDLLFDRGLEYSGFYEDGWISGNAFANLSRSAGASFRIDGLVPLVGDPTFTTELTIEIGSHEIARSKLGLGEFSIVAPVRDACRSSCPISLHFSRVQHLPGLNPRPVGALVHSLGF